MSSPNTRHLRILRRPEVQSRTGMGRTTIYMLERAGQFPKRLTIGPRSVGWYEHEVDQWLTARCADQTIKVRLAEIDALVIASWRWVAISSKLHGAR